jgi:hypothetical protein
MWLMCRPLHLQVVTNQVHMTDCHHGADFIWNGCAVLQLHCTRCPCCTVLCCAVLRQDAGGTDRPLPSELLALLSYLCPNELELQAQTGKPTDTQEQVTGSASQTHLHT